jgi:hypothetical protein
MTSQLRKIDQRAEILTSLYDNGRISEARYLASIKKLTDQVAKILARKAR